MGVIGDLVIKLVGDNSSLNKSLKNTSSKMKKFGADMKKIGANFSKFVTLPLVALGTASVAAFAQQEQAERKLIGALKATGKESEISAKAIFSYASELQKVTTFGDEVTISAVAMVQQLSNLDEQGLKKVIPGMQDFAAAMGVDLETAASLIGKTLGSTTNALGRYGIEIDTSATKSEKLEQLVGALNDKFGGMAAQLGDTTAGKIQQLKNDVGDLAEQFGVLISEALLPIIRVVKDIVGNFLALDDGTKRVILIMAGVAAAIGPVIAAIGALSTAFAFLAANPIIAVIAALGIVITLIATMKDNVTDTTKVLDAQAKAIRENVTSIEEYEQKIKDAFASQKSLNDEVVDYEKNLGNVNNEIGRLEDQLAGASKQQAGMNGLISGFNAGRETSIQKATREAKILEQINKLKATRNLLEEKIAEINGENAEEAKALSEKELAELERLEKERKRIAEEQAALEAENKKRRIESIRDLSKKRMEAAKNEVELNIWANDLIATSTEERYAEENKTIEEQREKRREDRQARLDEENAMLEALVDAEIEAAEKRKAIYTDFTDTVQQSTRDLVKDFGNSFLTAFDSFQTALMEGEDATKTFFETFAKSSVHAIGSFLGALSEQFLIQAAAALIPGLTFNPLAAAGYGAAALAARATGNLLLSLKEGGRFTVPPGFENDNFPMMVSSGERVTVEPVNNITNQNQMRLTIQLGSKIIYDEVNEGLENKIIRVPEEAIVS